MISSVRSSNNFLEKKQALTPDFNLVHTRSTVVVAVKIHIKRNSRNNIFYKSKPRFNTETQKLFK